MKILVNILLIYYLLSIIINLCPPIFLGPSAFSPDTPRRKSCNRISWCGATSSRTVPDSSSKGWVEQRGFLAENTHDIYVVTYVKSHKATNINHYLYIYIYIIVLYIYYCIIYVLLCYIYITILYFLTYMYYAYIHIYVITVFMC